jgi:hypothetical protein
MKARILRTGIALTLLLSLLSGLQSLASQQQEQITLSHHPLTVADALQRQQRWQEVRLLARFANDYLPVDPQYNARAMADEASRQLNDTRYQLQQFASGALTGEASTTSGLIGALSLDMLVLGDVRDLVVQGYREYRHDDGDPVIMALSATGLLLTLAPQASWAPATLKAGWRGGRLHGPLRDELQVLASRALHSGDFRVLGSVINDFSLLARRLGGAPAWRLLDEVESTAQLARLARSVRIAPIESYALVTINGISGLKRIKLSGKSSGLLAGPLKIAARQQRFLDRLLDYYTLPWQVATLLGNLLLLLWALRRIVTPAGRTVRRSARASQPVVAAALSHAA